MSRHYQEPITVALRHGRPVAFTWRGRTYHVAVIGTWKLQDRWWDAQRRAERWYWRVLTADYQVFELYCENGVRWVLGKVQD